MPPLYIYVSIAWALALAWWDFREHRLPDALTLPAIPVSLAMVASICPENMGIATGTGFALMAIGLLMNRLADLGLGDVKLLATVGIVVASTENPVGNLTEWFVVTALVGGFHAAIHLIITRDRQSHIPFGPSILAGMLAVVISG